MTARATSSGSSTLLPVGWPYCSSASSSPLSSRRSVATLPGWTVVTLRPVPAVSRRSPFERASTKNLLAEYTARPGKATRPASEEMVTMCPRPRPSILGSTAPTQFSAPLQLTSTVRSHSSARPFFMRVEYMTPARSARAPPPPAPPPRAHAFPRPLAVGLDGPLPLVRADVLHERVVHDPRAVDERIH